MPSFKSGRKDFIIIAVLLLAAAIVWLAYTWLNRSADSEKIYAEIWFESFTVEAVSLSKDRTFSIEQLPNVEFEVKDHKIAFVKSDCPDQVCVHTGWLESGGHFAACLPNQVMVWIVDEEAQGVDGVAR